jgi:tetratricopeptide (TPR) repeat protein
MRRPLVAFVVLAAGIWVGASVYTAYAQEQEYTRLIGLGDQAAAADRLSEALEAYSGAIALRPESMLAHLKRGLTYRRRHELEAAQKDLRRAVELDPTSTAALELLGDTQYALGRFDRAAEQFAASVALDDQSARGWYKLGLARYRARDLTGAREPLQRALALDRTLAEAQLTLGLCLRDLGDLRGARGPLEAAAQLAPALTAPREALASVYTLTGETSRAIDQFEALSALDPGRPERFIALGQAYARARRYDAAILTLSRAIERFPDQPAVYAVLGRVWLDLGEARADRVALNKAIEALTIAAIDAGATSETLSTLARARTLAGDPAGAERAYRLATARMPVYPPAYRQLATLAARANRLIEARDALIRYVTLVGADEPIAAAATEIAAYSMRLGDPATALRWINRAIDQGGETPALTSMRRRVTADAGTLTAR